MDDLTGRRFNRLLVLGLDEERSYPYIYWICQCNCAAKTLVSVAQQCLLRNKTKSCGCYRRENQNQLKRKTDTHNGLTIRYTAYKRAARKANRLFELSKEQFIQLAQQKCYYCHTAPELHKATTSKNYKITYAANGVDRKDSTQGYTLENCVTCCAICNYMKHTLTAKAFIAQCRKISLAQEALEHTQERTPSE